MSDSTPLILAALAKLDPKNEDHWTADKLPRLGAVGEYSRKEVTAAAPLFTRDSLSLVQPPKDVEVPPAPPAQPKTAFQMESSEFGGDEDDEEDEVDAGPVTQETVDALTAEVEAAAKVAADKLQVAESAKAEAEQATRQRDALVARAEAEAFVPESLRQQRSIMSFLSSGQKNKSFEVKAQIDKVMERKEGYGRVRPVFFPTEKK